MSASLHDQDGSRNSERLAGRSRPRPTLEIWFQHLTLPRLLWAMWVGKGHALQVVAPGASRAATTALALAVRSDLKIGFRQEVIEMGFPDPQGRALRYSVEIACARLGNRLVEALDPLAEVLPAGYRPFADDWRRILRAHFVAHAAVPLTFAYYAASRRAASAAGGRAIVYLSGRFLSSFIARNLDMPPDMAIETRAWPSAAERLAYLPLPGLIGFALYELLTDRMSGQPEIAVDGAAAGRGVVLEQYCQNILNQYPDGGHLFWHAHSGFPPERVVMLANRRDSPLDDDIRALFRRHRLGWVDGQRPLAFFPRPLRDGVTVLASALRFLPRRWNALEMWRWLQVAHFSVILEAHRHLARRLKVLMLHQNEEQTGRPLLLVLAVRMEGGMFFWNHWSVSHLPKAREGCGMADLLLAWGAYDEGFRTAMGFRYGWVARTGPLVAAALSPERRRRARDLRTRLGSDARFVIVLFDSSHGPDCHQPTWTLTGFLAQFFAAVREHPEWGVLLKSKGPRSLCLLDDPIVAPHKDALLQARRLAILDPEVQPAEAALASDICVSYSINTAGILSPATVPIRSLHCDVAGLREHLLYHLDGQGKVVFRDVPELVAALERTERDASDIGDFSRYVALFEPYGDGRGNERAGRLIGDYLRARDAGSDRDTALARAIEAFVSANGREAASVPAEVTGPAAQAWRRAVAKLNFEPYRPSVAAGKGP
jgi:hypothetical protein